jgi:hypothetical protein
VSANKFKAFSKMEKETDISYTKERLSEWAITKKG